jgi:hypothetical protein
MLKQTRIEYEDDFVNVARRRMQYHPHCLVPQLAVAEARRFDEAYAIACRPVFEETE